MKDLVDRVVSVAATMPEDSHTEIARDTSLHHMSRGGRSDLFLLDPRNGWRIQRGQHRVARRSGARLFSKAAGRETPTDTRQSC